MFTTLNRAESEATLLVDHSVMSTQHCLQAKRAVSGGREKVHCGSTVEEDGQLDTLKHRRASATWCDHCTLMLQLNEKWSRQKWLNYGSLWFILSWLSVLIRGQTDFESNSGLHRLFEKFSARLSTTSSAKVCFNIVPFQLHMAMLCHLWLLFWWAPTSSCLHIVSHHHPLYLCVVGCVIWRVRL